MQVLEDRPVNEERMVRRELTANRVNQGHLEHQVPWVHEAAVVNLAIQAPWDPWASQAAQGQWEPLACAGKWVAPVNKACLGRPERRVALGQWVKLGRKAKRAHKENRVIVAPMERME